MAYELKNGRWSVFANDKQGNHKRPDYRGTLKTPDGTILKLSGWVEKTTDGKAYLAGSCEYERPAEPAPDTEDEPERDGQLPF